MKKLSMLFVVAGLALGGCKGKGSNEKVDEKSAAKPVDEPKTDKPADPAAKPADPTAKPADPTAKPAETPTPAPAPTDTAAKPADNANLPPECAEYQKVIDKLATCDKVPADTRDTFKKAFDQAKSAWANIPAEAKATVAKACKSASDSVTAAIAACK